MPITSSVKILGVKDKSWMGKIISFVRGSPYNHLAIQMDARVYEMTPYGVYGYFYKDYKPSFDVVTEYTMDPNEFTRILESIADIKYDWLSLLLWLINHYFNTDFDDKSRMNCVEFVSCFTKDGATWSSWAPDEIVNYYLSRRV